MIQTNVLLATIGAAADSFVKVDVMRLPLGILSGMGFIGGGVILRRDTLVIGVTTAATLWFVTVVGLCFGGGQIGLGIAAVVVGYLALSALGFVEQRIERDRQTDLTLVVSPDGPSDETIRGQLEHAGLRVKVCQVLVSRDQRQLVFDVRERRAEQDGRGPAFLDELARLPGVMSVSWKACV